MQDNILGQMTSGIDHSVCVLVCITENYVTKTRGKAERGEDDNCKLEFEYAMHQKGSEKLIPVVMEERVSDPKSWKGPLGIALGRMLYKANFGNFPKTDDAAFKQQIRNVVNEVIRRCGGQPRDAAAPASPSGDAAPGKRICIVSDADVALSVPSSLRATLAWRLCSPHTAALCKNHPVWETV
jgi:hypothetical protein